MVIFFSPVNFPMCVTLYFCQVANVVSSELDGAGPAKHVKVSGFVSDSSAASNKNSKSDRKPKHLKGTLFQIHLKARGPQTYWGPTCTREDAAKVLAEISQEKQKNQNVELNIARSTLDPGYRVYNLNHFSDRNQFDN